MRKRKAMTLIELLLVVLILGALAAIALPRITTSAQTAKQNACDTNVGLINTQIELYAITTGIYPAALTTITGDPNYFPDNTPICPLGGTYSMGANSRVSCDH